MTTGTDYSTKQNQIWQDMLSGQITMEEGRTLLKTLVATRGYSAEQVEGIVEQLVTAAERYRQQGLAGEATWAQPVGPVTQQEAGFLAEEPRLAFNRAFNLPSVGANPFQEYQRNQLAPTYSAYAGKNILDLLKGQPGTSFGSYLGASDLSAAPQRALSTLQSLGGLGAPEQGSFLEQFKGEDVGGSLPALFQAALQGRGFASPFARAGARQLPGYEEEWKTRTLGGSRTAETGTLLNYLMTRLGLGG